VGKIADNKENKKRRLMETAFELYTSKGIVQTSIADIVEKSGVAKGTFYLYFKDKYDLRERLVIHKTEQILDRAIEASNYSERETPTGKILAIIDATLEELNRDKALLRFISKNLSWGVFKSAMENSREEKLAFFSSIMNQHDPKDIELAAYMIFELVGSACYGVILDGDPVGLEEFKPCLNRSISAIIDSFLNKDSCPAL